MQNLKPNPSKWKRSKDQHSNTRQTFPTAPHRFAFPRGKGCGQKSLPTTHEPSYVINDKSSKAHLTPFIGVRRFHCYSPNQRARRLEPKCSLSARMATEGS